MPKPGRASPVLASAARNGARFFALPLEVEVENLGEVVVFDGAREQHLQGVAEEGQRHDGCCVKFGYFLKMSLFSGSSMCASSPTRPSLRAF